MTIIPFVILLAWNITLSASYSFRKNEYRLSDLITSITTNEKILVTTPLTFDHYWQTQYYELEVPFVSTDEENPLSSLEKRACNRNKYSTKNI